MAGTSAQMNVPLHRPPVNRASQVPSRELGDAQRAQHQNTPTLTEVGPQESWPLPGGKDRLTPRCSTHAPMEVEDTQCLQCVAARTQSN